MVQVLLAHHCYLSISEAVALRPAGRPVLAALGFKNRMADLFQKAIAALGFKVNFTFHSLRHGGATQDCMDGVPISDIMRRGRWRSQRTCELYCQSGRAILATLEAPQELLRASVAYDADLVRMVHDAVANQLGRR